jgi:hypothetical protein
MLNNTQKLSTPSPGFTMTSFLKPWSEALSDILKCLRREVDDRLLHKSISDSYRSLFSPFIPVRDLPLLTQETTLDLAISTVISIWMLARQNSDSHSKLSYIEAIDWFFGNDKYLFVSEITECFFWVSSDIHLALQQIPETKSSSEILPYIFELLETLSKTSLDHANVRLTKRETGIFYTPSDVVEYIVQETLTSSEEHRGNLTILDPACGTGVFLLALLKSFGSKEHLDSQNPSSILKFAIQCLYGIDISHHAIQSCVFSLLSRCLDDVIKIGISPWRAWQCLRGNFAVQDSTLIAGVGDHLNSHSVLRLSYLQEYRNLLLNPMAEIPKNSMGTTSNFLATTDQKPNQIASRLLITDLFAECKNGFSYIVTNPPYSYLSKYSPNNHQNAFQGFESEKITRKINLYTLFIELAVKLVKSPHGAFGMVVPLSIAYHSGEAYRKLRRLIMDSGAVWRFSFFDRTPDSLFGDDVKTRNAIVLMSRKTQGHSEYSTTSLIRWNIKKRSNLFTGLRYISISDIDIGEFIPKLGTPLEKEAYRTLTGYSKKLGLQWRKISLAASSDDANAKIVYFYSTSYNWLSVFRNSPYHEPNSTKTAPNSLNALQCASSLDADFVYAALSSRLAYWLWRVHGDGFHLNATFLNRLPIHSSFFGHQEYMAMCEIGNAHWQEIRKHPIVSVNAGKATINYNPFVIPHYLDLIDELVTRALNLPPEFCEFLKLFIQQTVVAGRDGYSSVENTTLPDSEQEFSNDE